MMPTYKVGPGMVTATTPPKVVRPLICEQCFEALGNVSAVAQYTSVSANVATATWPEMAEQLRRHEGICTAPRVSGEDLRAAADGVRDVVEGRTGVGAWRSDGRQADDDKLGT